MKKKKALVFLLVTMLVFSSIPFSYAEDVLPEGDVQTQEAQEQSQEAAEPQEEAADSNLDETKAPDEAGVIPDAEADQSLSLEEDNQTQTEEDGNASDTVIPEVDSSRVGDPESYVPGEIIVSFTDGYDINGKVETLKEELCDYAEVAVEQEAESSGGAVQLLSESATTTEELKEEIIDTETFSNPVATTTIPDELTMEQAIAIAEATPGVASVQANYIYELESDETDPLWVPNDPLVGKGINSDSGWKKTQWWLYRTKTIQAWNNPRFPAEPDMNDPSTVTVAVIDSGADLLHPDIRPNLDVQNAWDAVFECKLEDSPMFLGTDYYDNYPGGHGTGVSATIAAVTDNGIGAAGLSNNRVKVLPINSSEFNQETKEHDVLSDAVLKALKKVLEYKQQGMNIRVINMSFGTNYNGDHHYAVTQEPVFYELLETVRDAGILPVGAGGNNKNKTSFHAPSDFDNVVAVTAADFEDAYTGDHNEYKDICAPYTIALTDRISGWTYTQNGSSFASPMVAGTAALLFATNPSLTPDQAQKILLDTADDIGEPGRDDYSGYGMLDVEEALEVVTGTEKAIDISKATVARIPIQTYTGRELTPEPAVTYIVNTLVKDRDYTLSYKNNTNVGTATVTITGKGSYSGSLSTTFTISQTPLTYMSDATVAPIEEQIYTGDSLTPAPIITYGGKKLVKSIDYTLSYANNIDPGFATVTITGMGSFTGTHTIDFRITKIYFKMTEVHIDPIPDQTYTGSPITPPLRVLYKGKKLIEGVDYTARYNDNTEIGTATVWLDGRGDYAGGHVTTFYIVGTPQTQTPISLADVAPIPDQTYSGSAKTPLPAVSYNGKRLVKDIDYAFSYANNINAGYATVTISGKGSYTGVLTESFAINKAALSAAYINPIMEQPYTGSEITPKPLITFGGKTLVQDVDYTLTYSNNVNVGTASITITGTGNFTGIHTASFKIADFARIPISSTTMKEIPNQTYSGAEKTPVVSLSQAGGNPLELNTDFTVTYQNNINAGTASITITGIGVYTGSRTEHFTINQLDMRYCIVTNPLPQDYTGSEITPSLEIEDFNRTLIEGVDYTLSYENNVKVGTATVYFHGIGNYTNAYSTFFEIVPFKEKTPISSVTMAPIPSQTYSGSAKVPLPTLTDNGKTLVKDTDYTLSYTDNIAAGMASITISGKGNYTGSRTEQFIINKAALSSVSVNPIPEKTYTGNAFTPNLTVKHGIKKLVRNVDYTVFFADNTDAGTASVTITGMGNYTGSRIENFTIKKAEISGASVNPVHKRTYTGGALTPNPYVTYNYDELFKNNDYTLSYADNINVGTATITITGKGNFTGALTTTFEIVNTLVPTPIADATINPIPDQVYTGSAVSPVLTLTLYGKRLVEGVDYLTVYTNNTDIGTATIFILGIDNYDGGTNTSFNIIAGHTQILLSSVTVAPISDQVYTGSAKNPLPTLTHNGKTLVKDTDYTLSYANNINVGLATITITGKGNYVSSREETFYINKAAFSAASVNPIADQTYTGSALTPNPSVTFGGKVLVKNIDYMVTYKDNVNVGTATVTIKAVGNYTGSRELTFRIVGSQTSVPISSATLSTIPAQTYSGSAKTPLPTLTYNGKTLVKDTDYTLSYKDNTNAGMATITITGKGNYTGSRIESFTINKAALSAGSVNPISDQTYTGSALTPSPTVTFGGKTLVKDTDYTLAYKNNTAVGTATITITGKGNYTGSLTASFKIVAGQTKTPISSATLIPIPAQTYSGSAKMPEPTITYGGKSLKLGTDYTIAYFDNINAGTASVTITGIGDFTGSRTETFTINKAALSAGSVNPIVDQTYTGSALTPNPTVTFGGKALVKDADYTLAYMNNVNVGTATITITGKGNYTGSLTATFKIVKTQASIPMLNVTVAPIPDQTYTGSAIIPALTLTYNGKELVEDIDYETIFRNNVNIGTAYVFLIGIGAYESNVVAPFKIVAGSGPTKTPISSATLTPIPSQTYSGSAKTPLPTLTYSGKTLVKDTDYSLAYTNNISAGTASITITGKGNYTGTRTEYFTINKAALSAGSVNPISDQTYTGSALTPSPTVTFGGKTLVKDTDYTLAYMNNVNVGTATITITGKGNYTGSLTASFKIVAGQTKTPISSAILSPIPAQTYSGSAKTPLPTLTYSGKTLVKDTDYTLSYKDNTNAGIASVTITGKGNYTGSRIESFIINKAALSAGSVNPISDQTYTGSALTPSPTVTFGGKTLTKDTDYTLTYMNNTAVGTATITITGKGNFTGSLTATFKIVSTQVSIPMSDVTVDPIPDQVYTGSALTPVLTLTYNGKKLVEGVDYDAIYRNNINIGTAHIFLVGNGIYENNAIVSFKIVAGQTKTSISSATLTPIPSQTYSGSAKTPLPTLSHSGKTLVKDTDYTLAYANNTSAGTATITITGKGNYTGTRTEYFTINKAALSAGSVNPISDQTYTGSALTPNPTVTFGGKTLVKDTDYTLAYMNNTAVGTATITITGKGNYTGSLTATFKIVGSQAKIPLSSVTAAPVPNQNYTGGALTPALSLTYSGKTLIQGTDYTVSYANNLYPGTARATISGMGSYTGSKVVTFEIVETSIDLAQVSPIPNQRYTGRAINPPITITYNGKTLIQNVDFAAICINNTNVGTATVWIYGGGFYSGFITASFQIVR